MYNIWIQPRSPYSQHTNHIQIVYITYGSYTYQKSANTDQHTLFPINQQNTDHIQIPYITYGSDINKKSTNTNSIYNVIIFIYRFLYCSPIWNQEVVEIDNSLSNYQINAGQVQTIESKIITHIAQMETSSMKQQFHLLSTISNFQHFQYPSLSSTSNNPSTCNESARYLDHILYDPTCRTTRDSLPIRKYMPSSPRNKCIYLASLEDSEGHLYKILKHLIYLDSLTEITYT